MQFARQYASFGKFTKRKAKQLGPRRPQLGKVMGTVRGLANEYRMT